MSVPERTFDREVVTPRLFAVVGVVTAVYCLFEVAGAVVARPTAALPPEASLLAVAAVGHLYTAYWLSTDAFGPEAVWRVGVGAAAAAVVATTTVVVAVPTTLGTLPDFETAVFLLVATGTDAGLVGVVLTALWLPSVPVGRHGDGVLGGGVIGDGGRVVTDGPAPADCERLVTLHSLVRHNVRNRVNVIDGRLDLLLEGATDVDEHQRATIETQLDAVLELLSDVSVAVDAVSDDRSREAVPLRAVVVEQASIMEGSHDGLSVTTDVDPELSALADDLLPAVVENVLSNAVEHHDREVVNVTVTAETDDDWIHLRVADDGPGVPDRFDGNALEPEVGDGSGMGLYLVDTLVSGYGGSVSLSDNEPRGTVVELTLPEAE
ncbi:sensor histidine kinase [Halobaculum sp. MBLA0143]|uniref:sensor histidine kinase n=1 Tax=Halobaculum sp. MBLA0143 TaxID=3079933 RepID=UPI0035259AB1